MFQSHATYPAAPAFNAFLKGDIILTASRMYRVESAAPGTTFKVLARECRPGGKVSSQLYRVAVADITAKGPAATDADRAARLAEIAAEVAAASNANRHPERAVKVAPAAPAFALVSRRVPVKMIQGRMF